MYYKYLFIFKVILLILFVDFAAVTHLSSQNYQVCFRRNFGNCYICYSPVIEAGTAAIAQASFGLR